MSIQIRFLGGAQTVTGSKFLVTASRHRYLIDCGLFQGVKALRARNREPFPVEPGSIDAVLLTHAHLDHSGHLPLLVKQGFSGRIHSTAPTRDLAGLILSDSAKIQEEDADFANRKGFSKHSPALPLYDLQDARRAMEAFEVHEPGRWNNLPGGSRFRLSPSSHILGSAFIELEVEGRRIFFSGDLGRANPLLYPRPSQLRECNYLVIESTYGDRTHLNEPDSPAVLSQLSEIVTSTVNQGGQLIIPSFAVGRTQELLLLLARLRQRIMSPTVPIYLDSPMGIEATAIFTEYSNWHGLTPVEIKEMNQITHVVRSRQESIEIMRSPLPKIVIAGSGMASGGRVLHHLASQLPNPASTVLLVGFQATGTRGRLLREGVGELKIHGRYVPVRARVQELNGLSAHADQSEILKWMRTAPIAPQMTFIVHGEPQASDALRVKMRDELGWESRIPAPMETIEL
jgi:metallo-beta-lactamase family protein